MWVLIVPLMAFISQHLWLQPPKEHKEKIVISYHPQKLEKKSGFAYDYGYDQEVKK